MGFARALSHLKGALLASPTCRRKRERDLAGQGTEDLVHKRVDKVVVDW
jgi:hypothetical protein